MNASQAKRLSCPFIQGEFPACASDGCMMWTSTYTPVGDDLREAEGYCVFRSLSDLVSVLENIRDIEKWLWEYPKVRGKNDR